MPSFNIKDYMLLALVLIIIGLLWSRNSIQGDLQEMTIKRDKKASELFVSKTNEQSLENAIILYNEVVENDRIDADKKHQAYIKAMKPETVTKYIKIYTKDTDENASECENINSILDNVISIGM